MQKLADVVLFLHVLFVAFVVVGLLLIVVGGVARWRWVRNLNFRIAHLAAIGIVVLQAWVGVICPLTSLEVSLRQRAGGDVYSGSFIGHWLERLLYFEAPPWVFTVCYTVFGAVVALTWVLVRPSPRRHAHERVAA